MSASETFANKVIDLRKRYGLSQEEMALRLGVSRNYVSMIENGRPPSASLQKLVDMMLAEGDNVVVTQALNEEPRAYSAKKDPAKSTSAERLFAGVDVPEIIRRRLQQVVEASELSEEEVVLIALAEFLENVFKNKRMVLPLNLPDE